MIYSNKWVNRMFDIRNFKFPDGELLGHALAGFVNSSKRRNVSYETMTGVVIEVVSNPYEYLNQQAFADVPNVTVGDVLNKKFKEFDDPTIGELTNYQLTNFMPMNSAFIQVIDDNAGNDNNSPVLCFPYFSSHISLPLKPGEYVWLLKEKIKGSSLYYWVSRKHGMLQVEDVNYTNAERNSSVVSLYNYYEKKLGSETPSEEMFDDANSFKNQKTNLIKSLEEIFSKSYAYRKEFTGEPVPRLSKNCSDLLIQGSNNTGIHLTTEKFSKNSEPKDFTQGLTNGGTLPTRNPAAGALDIYVGRKFEDIESLKTQGFSKDLSGNQINISKNIVNNEAYSYYENDKLADAKYRNTGIHLSEINDTREDAIDVAGRLYITNNSNFDQSFLSNFDRLESKVGPSSILFGKHTRIISDLGTRITANSAESFIDLNGEGSITIKAAKPSEDFKNDGKQLLKLNNAVSGITRLQAREGGAIHLAVRDTEEGDDQDSPPVEPYILHSELAPILKKLGGDVAFINQIIEILLSAIPPLLPLKTSIETARATAQAGGSASATIPAIENEITGETIPERTVSIPTELLGNNINNGNFVSDFASVVDNDIKSSKIFGE